MTTARSLTMTAEEAERIWDGPEPAEEAALAVAREAERRLLAKLRAVPDRKLQEALSEHVGVGCAEERLQDFRDHLVRLIEE